MMRVTKLILSFHTELNITFSNLERYRTNTYTKICGSEENSLNLVIAIASFESQIFKRNFDCMKTIFFLVLSGNHDLQN